MAFKISSIATSKILFISKNHKDIYKMKTSSK